MFNRIIENSIKKDFFRGKAIILTGPRQIGKTTLCRKLVKEFEKSGNAVFFNCDNPTDRDLLDNRDLEFLIQLIGEKEIIVVDEGQKVSTISQTAKLLVDHFGKKKQLIITGSSSVNLLENTEEALTGRKFTYMLFPLSVEELYPEKEMLKFKKELETLLIFGSYPEVERQKSFKEKARRLNELASSYLFKDILEFQRVKNSAVIQDLLKALALQVGSEVSFSELSNLLGIDKKTVESYVDLLEKNFIVFRIGAYAKNRRKEISKMKKIYFYDLGIRNVVINNLNFLDMRSDVGALWENFLAVERLKYQKYHNIYSNNFFWRTYNGSEIDWVEEREGKLFGYEFKFNDKLKTVKTPPKWKEYEGSEFNLIVPSKISGFIF